MAVDLVFPRLVTSGVRRAQVRGPFAVRRLLLLPEGSACLSTSNHVLPRSFGGMPSGRKAPTLVRCVPFAGFSLRLPGDRRAAGADLTGPVRPLFGVFCAPFPCPGTFRARWDGTAAGSQVSGERTRRVSAFGHVPLLAAQGKAYPVNRGHPAPPSPAGDRAGAPGGWVGRRGAALCTAWCPTTEFASHPRLGGKQIRKSCPKEGSWKEEEDETG